MSVHIRPLRLDAFEQLPKHARRCVFWEVDPRTLNSDVRHLKLLDELVLWLASHLADPEFEKEAWLSMVMLEWGSCGQVATPAPAGGTEDSEDTCLGYVLYAPPRAVPRAQQFPTGPVSADAVLLTSMGVEPGQPDGLSALLISHVVTELVRRGVRALEAFGRTAEAVELLDTAHADPQLLPAIEALGDCSFEECMIDASFLLDVGFTVVAPHRYFPRLRLELDKGLGWKAEIEEALERLLESAELQQPVGG